MQAWRLSLLAILSLETDGLASGNEGENERLRVEIAGRVKGLGQSLAGFVQPFYQNRGQDNECNR